VNLAASFAQTPTGREKVRGLFPFFEPESIGEALGETSQAGVLLARAGRLPLRGVEDPRPSLERLAAAGGLGFDEELRPLIAVARASAKIRGLLSDCADLPLLSRHLNAVPDLGEIARRAARLFEPDGTLSDRASPKLAELRGKLTRQRQRLYEVARTWLEKHGTSEDTVVMRDGRYCVPVAAGSAGGSPGSFTTDRIRADHLSRAVRNDRRKQRAFTARLRFAARRGENPSRFRKRDSRPARRNRGRREDPFAPRLGGGSSDFCTGNEGVLPEFSSDGPWELSGARHPLLDSRLASAREAVFGEERRDRDVVPLDVLLTSTSDGFSSRARTPAARPSS